MAADPNSFDHFRVGEPFTGIKGAVANTGFDYFRVGEAARALVFIAADSGAGEPVGVFDPQLVPKGWF